MLLIQMLLMFLYIIDIGYIDNVYICYCSTDVIDNVCIMLCYRFMCNIDNVYICYVTDTYAILIIFIYVTLLIHV